MSMQNEIFRYLRDLNYQISERPSAEQIKSRWKELCRKHHPDAGGKIEDFNRITHAYKMLTDPDYRHQEILREMRAGKANAKGDLNLRIQVPVSFDDAFFGRKVTVSWNRVEFDNDHKPVAKEEQDIKVEVVHLPAGCVHGHEHLSKDGGHKCGEQYGVAYIVFAPRPHARFKMQGPDVVSDEKIPLSTMLKGGKVEVSTMYGIKALRVPPGTRPGDKLVIKKCGLMQQGSHVVVVDPLYPDQNELKKTEWKGLGINWEGGDNEPDQEADEYILMYLSHKGTPYDSSST